jgi:hypothetical protein
MEHWNTHIHSVCIHDACMYLHPCAASYPDERIADAGPPHARAHVLHPCVCVRVCDWAPMHPRRHVGAPSVGVDRLWSGSQAFDSASAFNADIGAWNTARVTTWHAVCAAFSARGARHRRRDALGGSSMRRGPLCAAGPPMRARVCVCAQTGGPSHGRASTCVGVAARTKDGIYVCMYMYVFIYICMYYTYMYRYMCTCARDGYGRACGCSASHAHVRAIARADDAAVAITCASGYVRRYI